MADMASLQNLHDVVEPGAVGPWPLAGEAWVLIGLALLWVLVGGAVLWSRHRRNGYRRAGLQELAALRRGLHTDGGSGPAVLQLSALLKRVALSAFPREQVASLNGDPWLAFLDETLGEKKFSAGAGTLLADGIYRPAGYFAGIPADRIEALFGLAGKWIREHRAGERPEPQSRSFDDHD